MVYRRQEREFAAGEAEPRCPLVLVLDTSSAMSGGPIAELNAGLAILKARLMDEALAQRWVEIAVVTFGHGGVRLLHGFTAAGQWEPAPLEAAGEAPLGEAITLGLDALAAREAAYRAGGVPCIRPWIVVVAAGTPSDAYEAAAERLRAEETQKAAAVFAVQLDDADPRVVSSLSARPPVTAGGPAFRHVFLWLSAGQKRRLSEVPIETPVSTS